MTTTSSNTDYVLRKDLDVRRRLLADGPPRSFGPLDQFRVDLGSGQMIAIYLFIATSLALAAITGRYSYGLPGVLGVWVIGRGYVMAVGLMRHGVMTTARIRSVQQRSGRKGMNQGELVDGVPTAVSFEVAPVDALLAHGSEVEMQVIAGQMDGRPRAHAYAYRAAAQ